MCLWNELDNFYIQFDMLTVFIISLNLLNLFALAYLFMGQISASIVQ